MDNLNNNRGSLIRIQTGIGDIGTSDRKIEFLVRAYLSDNDVIRTVELKAFMVGGALWFNLLLACISCHNDPRPEMTTQDVHRFINKNPITNRAMQSCIFPVNIVAEANKVDHFHPHNRTPTPLYPSIRGTINLVHKVDLDIVFKVTLAFIKMNTTKHINIVELPPPNNKRRIPPWHYHQTNPSH